MYGSYQQFASQQLEEIRHAGTYKSERVITTPQGSTIRVADGKPVLNLCANNYLGLANHPDRSDKPPARRWTLGLRHGLRPVHLRHAGSPQATRTGDQHLPGHRGHDPL